jgi:hypothetical protein
MQPSHLTEFTEFGPAMATDDEPEMNAGDRCRHAFLAAPSLARLSVAVSPCHAFIAVPTFDIQIHVPSLADEGQMFVAT